MGPAVTYLIFVLVKEFRGTELDIFLCTTLSRMVIKHCSYPASPCMELSKINHSASRITGVESGAARRQIMAFSSLVTCVGGWASAGSRQFRRPTKLPLSGTFPRRDIKQLYFSSELAEDDKFLRHKIRSRTSSGREVNLGVLYQSTFVAMFLRHMAGLPSVSSTLCNIILLYVSH